MRSTKTDRCSRASDETNGQPPTSRFATNDVGNVLKIGSYATYDVRAGWRHVVVPGLTFGVEGVAYNLTDREYVEGGGFGTFSVPPRIAFFPAPGRNYLASVFVEYEL